MHERMPRPVLLVRGPLDGWLSASSMQADVNRAAKLLALAEISMPATKKIVELAKKTTELEIKLAAAERENKKLEAKLKRA